MLGALEPERGLCRLNGAGTKLFNAKSRLPKGGKTRFKWSGVSRLPRLLTNSHTNASRHAADTGSKCSTTGNGS